MPEVVITKKLFRKLANHLGDEASVLEDEQSRRYLEMHYDQLQASEQRAVAMFRGDAEVHYFYYIMPPNSRNPRTDEAVAHPNSIETGGEGILWRFLRIGNAWSIRYPAIDQADIYARFTYEHHDTRRQSRARAGFVAARIQVLTAN